MHKYLWLSLFTIAGFVSCDRSTGTQVPKPPEDIAVVPPVAKVVTVRDVLERYVAVTGSRAIYQKRQSVVMRGIAEMGAAKGPVILQWRPSRFHGTVRIAGKPEHIVGRNGDLFWVQDSAGTRLFGDVERAEGLPAMTLNHEIQWETLYDSIELVGQREFAGQTVHELRFVTGAGTTETRLYDVATGFLLQSQWPSQQSEMRYSDYRAAEGILYPFTIHQTTAAGQMVLRFDSIAGSATVYDEVFTVPSTLLSK